MAAHSSILAGESHGQRSLAGYNPQGCTQSQTGLKRLSMHTHVLGHSAMFDICNPMDCRPSGSSVHGILQQEYWSGLPFPSPGDLPDPGIEPGPPALQADSLPTEL